ncbi:MAG: polysaccharide lyase family 8 super-sandwich domain-containing protein [Victivallales bacterium]
MKLILERYRQYFMGQRGNPEEKNAGDLLTKLREDGSWGDIDYASKSRTGRGWQPHLHLVRMVAIARCYATEGNPLHNSGAVKDALAKALDYWVEKTPKSPNWWLNEIGVPRQMRDFLVVYGAELDPKRFQAAMEILKQFKVSRTAANLTWSADLALHYGVLSGDAGMVGKMSERLAAEIKTGENEGIQDDFSFFQHGARLQQFQYGAVFLNENMRIAWQLRNTPWAFPPDKVDILRKYLLDGTRWMMRWAFIPPGTLDRAVSRPGTMKCGDGMAATVKFLAELEPAYAADCDALIGRLSGEGESLVGARNFPKADFSVYHRRGFSFFIKTRSDRTFGVEVGLNGENLKGDLLGNGDTYLIRDGDEYFNMPPLWNWELLPGVTFAGGASPRITKISPLPFTGALSDGTSLLTVMDCRYEGGENGFGARKAWFAHDDMIACLIGGLKAENMELKLRTAMDQSRLRGPVTVADSSAEPRTVPPGDVRLDGVRWIHHGGFAYLMMNPSVVTVHSGPVYGSWKDINKELSDEKLTDNVFLPIVEHAAGFRDASAAYLLSPCSSPADAQKLFKELRVRVLKNDGGCQAVEFADGTRMVAFYVPGVLEADGSPLLAVDAPCLVMSRKDGQILLVDPTHMGCKVKLTVGRKSPIEVAVPKKGIPVAVQAP